ncbi:MAG TPA: hypothetical protein VKR59_19420 [Terriglobales bacterium]|nr:hypothetical protein [Terriglobales bacterium]
MKRFLWLGFVALVYVICSGCGDTFRPIIIPNPPTFPSPRAAHSVVSINDNGTFVAGSAMVIDVSGGSDVSIHDADVHPVHAVQLTASSVLVVNQAATNLDQPALPLPLLTTTCNVTYPPTPPPPNPPPPNQQVYNVCPSITKLNFNSTVISSSNTISLPPYSGSNFVAGAPTDNFAYVTMPTYPPDPTQPTIISPSVGVISTLSNNLTTIIPVGKNPIALAVTPDKSKLYVANNGDSTISGFNTADRSARVISPANTSLPPIWLVPRNDNQRVFVLEANAGGTSSGLASLDTTSTAGPDLLTEYPTISVPGATIMIYDSNLNRLYIPGGQEVAIVDVSQSSPQYLAGGPITIPTVSPDTRFSTDPCFSTSTQPVTVGAVAALPDGSRAYVGGFYETAIGGTQYICPQVTVIDAKSNAIKTAIGLPGFPAYDTFCAPSATQRSARFRIMMAAAGDSTAAYLSSCDGGNVNIIDTSNDTYSNSLLEPVGSRLPIPPSSINPPQNPVFLFAGP